MCGICGLASLDGRTPPDREVLAAMSETLVHRGPDSDGSFVDGPIGLAARRLSIIDLDGGDQPISNEDATVTVVQNGEIYNHAELRRELETRGHRFATRSDTEVLVHLYEEHGDEMLPLLRGMFAIALWDSRKRRLLLARDPFGIKPLYYRNQGGVLSFGSELKALRRQPGFSSTLDLRAVEAFLAFNSIPAPLTIYAEARKLPAGHLLAWEGGDPKVRRYERPGPVPAAQMRSEGAGDLARELRERLRDSVRAHLVSDVPVGVLLSGGIDSSVLTAIASEESSEPVKTFSIGFEEQSFDELDRARLIAQRYGTDHHELVLRPDAAELLPRLVDVFDEPFGDSSAVPTYLVSELAAKHVKVALSGEGGDELFGGYYTYVADRLAPRLAWAARLVRPAIERLPSSSGKVSLDYRAKRFVRAAGLPPLERHHAWKEIFSADAREGLLQARADGWDPVDIYRARYEETAGAEQLARFQDVDFGIYLVDDLRVKTDRASMAHSLELRVPFLDREVADFAFALPRDQRVRGLSKKRLLRRAAAPFLPDEVTKGPKQGFSIPVAAWLRNGLGPFAREALSPAALDSAQLLDPAAATQLIDAHQERREDYSRQIWGLMALSLWCQRQRAAVG